MGQNVLIVYTHQSETSFNGAALDTAVKALQAQNCNVVVSDLYAMKFKAFATAEDITGKSSMLSSHPYQFPLLWFSMPAILKGWIDWVFTQGGCIMKDKKAMMSFTTGSHESMCHADGINGDINITLWSLQVRNGDSLLRNCVWVLWLPPSLAWCVVWQHGGTVSSAGWCERMWGLLEEKPLIFVPFANFDVGAGFKLKKEVQGSPVVLEFGLLVIMWGNHCLLKTNLRQETGA
uniref:Flavodoxin-like fold domain-containing protein n=1 Tax=Scleropages formosus TaxID=113540 RepID=A0A8C9VMF1_SCLFO